MLNRILKIIFALPLVLVMFLIVLVNVKLSYRSAPSIDGRDPVNIELLKELRGLQHALNDNADVKMQKIFPEGYVFLNSIYALAWCNFLQRLEDTTLAEEGLAEVQRAWTKINSSKAKARFNPELPFPYGSFYNGWNTYVLGSKLRLESIEERKDEEIENFRLQCNNISAAIQERTYPMSYAGSAWPADVFVCVASLSLHDKVFKPQYQAIIRTWLAQVKERYDTNGMIPHSVRPFDGKIREGARGSSQALMLIFLQDIDEALAAEHFKLFKERFVDSKFGLTGIREYPKGKLGAGDIDSGPLVFGFGGAATIVGMYTLSIFGEHDVSNAIAGTVEALGFPFGNDRKKYFFGLLPIADAFIAWSHSGMDISKTDVSFLTFRAYSVSAFVLLSVFFWILISGNKPDSKRSLHVDW